jgi:allantoate deiminase
MRFGTRLMQQAEDLARFSQDPDGLTRTYLSAQHRQAGDYLLVLMHAAGMQAGYDALGNVVGRYAGQDPHAPVLMSGSHLDSVVNAGKYDGLFGILSAIACVHDLNARGVRLPQALEVIGFCDEEGVRFNVTMIGSAALSGHFEPAWLDQVDGAGVSMRTALAEFGGDAQAWASLQRDFARVACFVESHIEQGPVLLDAGLPLGVVTAIAGCTRVKLGVSGLAGHAGTVPMPGRRDALAAAAEMITAIEQLALARAEHLVATVGKLSVAGGGAVNVIAGAVEFTLDLRSGDDAARQAALAALHAQLLQIAQRRGVTLEWQVFYALDAAPCDARLQRQLAAAIAAQGVAVRHLASGAGHDAMQFAARTPTAMLFVRCGNGGISHNPLETMTAADAEIATAALLHFIEHFTLTPDEAA